MSDSVVYWARVLGESKHHMVRATLALVGEEGMRAVAADAERLFSQGAARTLGGGFMLVIKNRDLYDAAKLASGEKQLQRERCSRRRRRKQAINEKLCAP